MIKNYVKLCDEISETRKTIMNVIENIETLEQQNVAMIATNKAFTEMRTKILKWNSSHLIDHIEQNCLLDYLKETYKDIANEYSHNLNFIK